jgi:hypothetical protein
MSQAVNEDRTYAPKPTYSYSGKPGWWVLSGITVGPSRHLYKRKPASTFSPLVKGWRDPRSWDSAYKDFQEAIINTVIERRNNSSGSWTKIAGRFTGISPPVPVVPALPAYVKAQMEINCLNKLREGDVSLGVSLGERREAAGMMLANFGKIAKAYRALRKGEFSKAADALGIGYTRHQRSRDGRRYRGGFRPEDVPSRWLEYQYGWKPLLSDVYNAAEAIVFEDYESPTRTYYHVKERQVYEESPSITTTVNTGIALVTKSTQRIECLCRFDFYPDWDEMAFKTADDWGMTNPLSIAWELVPFSFVVDWALPIGDYLNALTAAKPYTLKGGSFSTYGRTRFRHELKGVSSGAITVRTCFGDGQGWALGHKRSVYGNFPFPDYRALAHTKHKNATSESIATRTANAMSILSKMFS